MLPVGVLDPPPLWGTWTLPLGRAIRDPHGMSNTPNTQEGEGPPSSSPTSTSSPSTSMTKTPRPPWVCVLLHPVRAPLLRLLELQEDAETLVARTGRTLRRALDGLDEIAGDLVDLTPETYAALRGSIQKDVEVDGGLR